MLTDRTDRILARIAGAVADGEAVDWSSAERILSDQQRGVVRALRTIADSAETTQGATALERTSPVRLVSPWLWLILGLGACHLLLGLLGLVLGTRGAGPSAEIWERAAMPAFGGAAIWLVRGGSRDPRALWLAGVLITIASAFAVGPADDLAASRGWAWAGRPWWNVTQVEGFLPFCLWSFVRSFPRVLHLERTERLIRLAIGLTAAAGVALFLLNVAVSLGAVAEPPRRLVAGGSEDLATREAAVPPQTCSAAADPLGPRRARPAAVRVARTGRRRARRAGPP